jgi:suppressor for copper-sensitivity B
MRALYPLIFIIYIFISLCSFAQPITKIDEVEYDLSFIAEGYDPQTQNLLSLIKINLKGNWKIFAKNKASEEIQTQILFENKENINSITIQWPTPIQLENKAFYYLETLEVPVVINVIDPNLNAELDLNIFISICDKSCVLKKHLIHLNVPTTNNLIIDRTSDFFKILLIAFIGGILLNFMPCILPVLSIKILSVLNTEQKERKFIRYQFFATTIGIIISFIILAAIAIILKTSGNYAGLGLNFQQPEFIILLTLALVFFAASLANRININIPSNLNNLLIKYSDEGQLFGSFLAGVFATLLSTPCTAPFIGTAISFALLYNNLEIYSIFITIGLGMALPYLILTINPNLLRNFPRPGKWMLTIKKILAILVYLTVLWLMFILVNLLDQKSAIILFLCALLLQFLLENKQGILKFISIKLILCLAIVIAAFLLPKLNSHNDLLREQEINLVWKRFDQQQLAEYIAKDKVILVDVTADWCITCKYNKFMVLDNEYMLSYYLKNNIITMRADYTAASKEISNYLASYNQRGIPFDVVYSKKYPHGIILPPLLKTSDVLGAINKAMIK